MNEKAKPSISELMADTELITEAIARGAREALLRHARAGQSVAIWQDGKVVWIPAEDILARLAGEPGEVGKTTTARQPNGGAWP